MWSGARVLRVGRCVEWCMGASGRLVLWGGRDFNQ